MFVNVLIKNYSTSFQSKEVKLRRHGRGLKQLNYGFS